MQPSGIQPGIYFNLSNDDYHSDPALSHSGMTKVLLSWQDYWLSSCLNPEIKKFERTEAMKFGERSGMLLLEPQKFYREYNTYGKSKPDAKGVWLSSTEWRKLHDSISGVMEVPIAKQHFADGYAEVSIFWRDPGSGIMLRARIDYLRTFGAIDFKRIVSVDNWGIGRAVKAQGLDIQNFLYLEGIKAARAMLSGLKPEERAKLAHKEEVDLQWLIDFMEDTDLLFRFLFQRSAPPYIWEFRELDNEVLAEGARAVFAAIQQYKKGLQKYGIGKPPMGCDTVKTVSPYHVPRRDYDYEN